MTTYVGPDDHSHCEMIPDPALARDRAELQPVKGADADADVQGEGGTTRSAAAPKVERPAADPELDDDGMPRAGKPEFFGKSNVRPVSTEEDAKIQETVDAIADQYGLPDLKTVVNTKPPEGKGAPAAPSPVFQTWDGKTVHYGSVICPVTAPDSQWIAGAEDADFNTGCIWLQHLHTDARMLLSREACGKCWELAVHRASAAPVVDPVDIATTAHLELSALLNYKDANVRSSAQRVVNLTNRLFRCCAK